MKVSGETFQTSSDTEVLLYKISRDGTSALRDLNGMFAFAHVDKRTGDWILARDPFGIKPLYYLETQEGIAFASEIKALLVLPGVAVSVDRTSLQQYLTFQFCLGGRTMFEGIKQLSGGQYLCGRYNEIKRPITYWDVNYNIDYHHTHEYFEDSLISLLEDSCKLQVRSDVPLGAYISGGLDSSLVAAKAAAVLNAPLPVFHGRFEEGSAFDESSYAKAVSRHINADYHETVPTAQEFVDYLPRIIYALDEPVAGPGVFPQYMVSKLAAQHVKVVLGGQGGDEIFAGYARYLIAYFEQALKGSVLETQEEGRHIVSLASLTPSLPLLKEYLPLMQQLFGEGLFGDMDRRYFRLIDRSPQLMSMLSSEMRSEWKHEEVFSAFQTIFNHPDTASYLNKMTHFDQKTLLPALLQIEDRVSMAVSLESRVPLLDTRIVDLITTMPPPLKFSGGRTKHTLKQAARGALPSLVLERKDKMGFPVPLAKWSRSGLVREFIHDTLTSRASLERGIFSRKHLESITDESSPGSRQLWGALCIELWHRTYVDRGTIVA
jgi:asparagine synthase (glutamine-hydrolysing)